MGMNDLVSVVVPVYNVESYLYQCIDSIVSQTHGNLQIILVDDGSTDGSGIACDKWAQKDNRVIVVHKQNAGLGFARNTGLDCATGKYVVFIDSDDFVDKQMIQIMLDRVHQYGADTVRCKHQRFYSNGKVEKYETDYSCELVRGDDIVSKVMLDMVGTTPDHPMDYGVSMSACFGMYSLDIIRGQHIRFCSEREFISEDLLFNMDYLMHAQCVAFVSEYLYYYRSNEKSLSQRYNPQRFIKEIIFYHEVKRRLRDILPESVWKHRPERLFLGRVRSSIMRVSISPDHSLIREIRKIIYTEDVGNALKSYPFQLNPIQQRIFNYCMKNHLVLLVWAMARVVAKKNLRR